MTAIPSALLAMAIGIACHGWIHRLFGTGLGTVVDFALFVAIYIATNRFLKNLRNG